MKLLILSLILFSTTVLGQKKADQKLQFNGFAISPLEFFSERHSFGVSISSDVSFRLKKNIFTVSAGFGEEFSIWNYGYNFLQINLLYGKEIEFAPWFFTDANIGAGLLRIKHEDSDSFFLGIPIQLKLRFKTGKRFSFGLRFQSNLNSERSIHTYGIVLQWNRI